MKILRSALADDPQNLADDEAVLSHVFDGKPLSSEVAERVREHGRQIAEELRRVHGVIDDATFQSLLSDDEA